MGKDPTEPGVKGLLPKLCRISLVQKSPVRKQFAAVTQGSACAVSRMRRRLHLLICIRFDRSHARYLRAERLHELNMLYCNDREVVQAHFYLLGISECQGQLLPQLLWAPLVPKASIGYSTIGIFSIIKWAKKVWAASTGKAVPMGSVGPLQLKAYW
eukprot:3783138-Pyramimonas_sp.AAC.1